MKPTVWIRPGIVSIFGKSLDAAPHGHNSMQIIWGKGQEPYLLNGLTLSGATIIDSMFKHRLEMNEGWILLIEPKSELGAALSAQLADSVIKSYDIPHYPANEQPSYHHDPMVDLAPLFDSLCLPKHLLKTNEANVADKRIQTLLIELNHCLQGECIKPSSWKAAEVASQLALSESRFLHLFSEAMGIAWRPYLLWRRMMCAIQAINNNASATDAAHLAGFSDSAHLSRTFKNSFGMSIRQALKLFDK